MTAFDYPFDALSRRHGPQGYTEYRSYRPWLRDEFTFRCVYCLKREQWGYQSGDFDLDHFEPQIGSPERATDYDNLLYSCHTCNQRKSDRNVPDPRTYLTRSQVRIRPDGAIEGLSSEAEKTILVLGLNSEKLKEFRLTWMRIIDLAKTNDVRLYASLMGFPQDLPDLSRLHPPGGNTRADGVVRSYFAMRQRGELPETY